MVVTRLDDVRGPHGPLAVWSEGDGRRLVLHLHGLGGDHVQALGFTPAAGEISGAADGWRRVAPDMRGHGETEVLGEPASLTFAAFADDALAVLESMGELSTPAAIVGMSMGAEIALHVASARPDLVGALVLIRPAFAPGVARNEMLPVYRRVRQLLEEMGAAGVTEFVRTPEYRSVAKRSEQAASSLVRQFERSGAAERAAVLTAIPSSEVLPLESVRSIGCPALVLVSPEDPAHPMTCGRVLAGVLPGAEPLVVLPKKSVAPGPHEEQMRAHIAHFLMGLAVAAGGNEARPLVHTPEPRRG